MSIDAKPFLLLWGPLVLLSACSGPGLYWTGKSPDRTRTAYLRKADGGMSLQVDSELPRHTWPAISHQAIAFSPDGCTIAFGGRREDGKWYVHHDSVSYGPYEGVAVVRFGATRQDLFFVAKADGHWRPVFRGQAYGAMRSVFVDSVRVAADRWAIAGEDADGVRVWWNGRPGAVFDAVADLTMSADGTGLLYTARRSSRSYVVHNGQPDQARGRILSSALSPSGHRSAYVVADGIGVQVVVDGRRYPGLAKASDVRFTIDSSTVAWMGTTASGDSALFVNGQALGPEGGSFEPDRLELAIEPFRPLIVESSSQGDRQRLVVGGVPGPWATQISGPVVSANGRHFIRGRFDGAEWTIYVDENNSPQGRIRDLLDGSLTIDNDGGWGAVSATEAHTLQYVVNGRPVGAVSLQEIVSASFDPAVDFGLRGQAIMTRWARAEIERVSHPRRPGCATAESRK